MAQLQSSCQLPVQGGLQGGLGWVLGIAPGCLEATKAPPAHTVSLKISYRAKCEQIRYCYGAIIACSSASQPGKVGSFRWVCHCHSGAADRRRRASLVEIFALSSCLPGRNLVQVLSGAVCRCKNCRHLPDCSTELGLRRNRRICGTHSAREQALNLARPSKTAAAGAATGCDGR